MRNQSIGAILDVRLAFETCTSVSALTGLYFSKYIKYSKVTGRLFLSLRWDIGDSEGVSILPIMV